MIIHNIKDIDGRLLTKKIKSNHKHKLKFLSWIGNKSYAITTYYCIICKKRFSFRTETPEMLEAYRRAVKYGGTRLQSNKRKTQVQSCGSKNKIRSKRKNVHRYSTVSMRILSKKGKGGNI